MLSKFFSSTRGLPSLNTVTHFLNSTEYSIKFRQTAIRLLFISKHQFRVRTVHLCELSTFFIRNSLVQNRPRTWKHHINAIVVFLLQHFVHTHSADQPGQLQWDITMKIVNMQHFYWKIRSIRLKKRAACSRCTTTFKSHKCFKYFNLRTIFSEQLCKLNITHKTFFNIFDFLRCNYVEFQTLAGSKNPHGTIMLPPLLPGKEMKHAQGKDDTKIENVLKCLPILPTCTLSHAFH